VTAGQVSVGDRLEVGDIGNSFGDADGVGTLTVDGDLELTGDAVYETTLASSDMVEVNNGGVTLTNSPSVEIVTDAQFDETASFTVLDNDGTSDAISGSFADTTLMENGQEFLLNLNAGDGNDLVINRQDTERVDPTTGSTDRGGTDDVETTTKVSVTGEEPAEETVTDPLDQQEQATMAGDIGREGQGEVLPDEEVSEQDAASSTSEYLRNSANRNRNRIEQLQQRLDQLESAGQGDTDEAEELREQVEFLTDLANRQEQTQQQMADDQAVTTGEEEEERVEPHTVGIHNVSTELPVGEITANQLRELLLNDLRGDVFSDAMPGPVLGAILSGLLQQPTEEPPGVAELRDVTRMGSRWSQIRGDSEISRRMEDIRHDAAWWVDEKTVRFRNGVHGDEAPWGLSVVDVRMSQETGQYVLHASVWIDEGASNMDIGGLFGEYAGDELNNYEGSWHTLTLTGQVRPQ
jgi:hypothetical protein